MSGRLAFARVLPLAIALGCALASPLAGQGNRRTQLTITGAPLVATGTTATDIDAGSIALGSVAFSVDLTTNTGGAGFSPRVTTVSVRCGLPCPASGTLAVGSLQWRRSDLATWNALTTTFAIIEARTATFNGTNDPWSNTVFWRYVLSWTGSPPAAATTFNIEYDLTVTAP